MEEDLERRVREALETPPPPAARGGDPPPAAYRDLEELEALNAHVERDLTEREREYVKNQRWRVLQAKKRMAELMTEPTYSLDRLGAGGSRFNLDQLEAPPDPPASPPPSGSGAWGAGKNHTHYARVASKALANFGALSELEKHEFYYAFTRRAFTDALRTGRLPDGSAVTALGGGRYTDKYGIVRDEHGPFWPSDYGPLHPTPVLKRGLETAAEHFYVYGQGRRTASL